LKTKSVNKPFIGMQIPLWNLENSVELTEGPINSGRSADIWKGEFDGLEVAVKIYRPIFDDGGLLDESVEREYSIFCDDNRIVSALGRGIINYRNDRWSHVLVLPLIHCEALSELINNGKMKKLEKLSICKEITNALIGLHNFGMIHGDLNPNNILASPNTGEAFIVDFEFSMPLIREVLEGNNYNTARGTPGYIAPEVDSKGINAISSSSDVWSLGWTIAEVLNRKNMPMNRNWRKHEDRNDSKISMLEAWNSEFGEDIDEAVRKCVIIDKNRRIKLEELEEAMTKYE